MATYIRELLKGLLGKLIRLEPLLNLVVAIIMIIFWVFIAYLVFRLAKFLVFKANKLERKLEKKETKEQLTVKRLINNIIRALFLFWITIMILKELGIDIVPLLAGAGVLAFAVGFGAQELIKDVISGMFLILEKTIAIDDLVLINDIKGTVIDVGIRRTKIVTWKNELVTFNNGDIRTVTNFSVNPGLAVVEFNLDPKFDLNLLYNEDFVNFLEKFKENNEDVQTQPSLPHVMDLNNSISFRITFETEIRRNVSMERQFRKELYNYFVEKGITIEIPVVISKLENE